jgi:integrase
MYSITVAEMPMLKSHINVDGAQTLYGGPSLADVRLQVEADSSLSNETMIKWIDTLDTLARYWRKDPAALPASMQGLRYGLELLSIPDAALSTEEVNNLRVSLREMIDHANAMGWLDRNNPCLTDEWRHHLDSITDRNVRPRLLPFARFCSVREITPSLVNEKTISLYVTVRSAGSFSNSPQSIHKDISRAWNRARTQATGWPDVILSEPNFRPKLTRMQWDAFNSDFVADVKVYLNWLSGNDLLAHDAPLRPCKSSTVDRRQEYVRLAASAAIEGGIPVENLCTLADLVSPATVKIILEFYLSETNDKGSTFIVDMAERLTSIAKSFVRSSDEDLEELAHYCRKLAGFRRNGLTDKNMKVVRAIQDVDTRRRLIQLPGQLIEQAQASESAPYQAAVLVQTAIVIQILLVAPMRISNLANLSLNVNVVRPRGEGGIIHLVIPPEEVKNDVALDFPIPDQVTALIDLYLRDFRPALHGAGGEWLFPGMEGHHKCASSLSAQISRQIKKSLGMSITAHQFRHIAGAIILEADPGNYELVRRVLGHKNIQTTINSYVGLETAAAVRKYASLVLGEAPNSEGWDHGA